MDVVLKPFNALIRRYRAGEEISERDDIAPHDYADFKTRGFIGSSSSAPVPAHTASEEH